MDKEPTKYTNVISFKTKKFYSQDALDRFVEAQTSSQNATPEAQALDAETQAQIDQIKKIWFSQVLELITIQNAPFRQDELYNVAMAMYVQENEQKLPVTQTTMSQVVADALQMASYTRVVFKSKNEQGLEYYTVSPEFRQYQIRNLMGALGR